MRYDRRWPHPAPRRTKYFVQVCRRWELWESMFWAGFWACPRFSRQIGVDGAETMALSYVFSRTDARCQFLAYVALDFIAALALQRWCRAGTQSVPA